jgi:Holliday junction resolvase RusA-like endonuclease
VTLPLADSPPLPTLQFWVPGRPQTAGSKVSGVAHRFNKDTGMHEPVRRDDGRLVTFTMESGKKDAKRAWRGDLRDGAERALQDVEWDPSLPMRATFVFQRPRPKGHYGSGRNAAVIKPGALVLMPVQRPDVLKLARAAEDALTGIVWNDDAQIVQEELAKVWGPLGCRVAVEPLAARV